MFTVKHYVTFQPPWKVALSDFRFVARGAGFPNGPTVDASSPEIFLHHRTGP